MEAACEICGNTAEAACCFCVFDFFDFFRFYHFISVFRVLLFLAEKKRCMIRKDAFDSKGDRIVC